MKQTILIWLFSLCSIILNAQTFGLKVKCQLSDTVSETSGLINLNGHFFTHEDSGGEPNLYEIDTSNGSIKGIYQVKGSANIDWEDITADDSFIYVGDFGNNAGMRKDLCIYKLSISGILARDTQLQAQKILFSYGSQTDYSNKTFQTNFDAEAMVSMGNHLYIFSKNWGNFKSYVYQCSKQPGTYVFNAIDSFNASGLITGAEYDAVDSQLVLCGYTFNNPFAIGVNCFQGKFDFKHIKRTDFSNLGVIQIEAVCKIGKYRYLLSSEKSTSNAQLYSLNLNQVQMKLEYHGNTSELLCYPNPLTNILKVKTKNLMKNLQIYNRSRQIVFVAENIGSNEFEIDLSNFPSGEYNLILEDEIGRKQFRTIIK